MTSSKKSPCSKPLLGIQGVAPVPIIPADCLDNCLNPIIMNSLCIFQPRYTSYFLTRKKQIYLALSGRERTRGLDRHEPSRPRPSGCGWGRRYS